jgi:hypothetical protein
VPSPPLAHGTGHTGPLLIEGGDRSQKLMLCIVHLDAALDDRLIVFGARLSAHR